MHNDEGLGAAMGAAHQDDRIAILEQRQALLLRAMRGDFAQSPIGEFEFRWNAINQKAPAPPQRSVRFLSCECEICVKSYDRDVERPIAPPKPLDGARLWGGS